MKILVVYFKLGSLKNRNTIDEHLYCFRRYVKGVKFYYFNAANGIPRYLTYPVYHGVILHYTFLAARWSPDFYEQWKGCIRLLRHVKGYMVAMPQDEYAETEKLWELFRECHVKSVFTCFFGDDCLRAYPREKTGDVDCISVAPGYVDERAAERLRGIWGREKERPIDLGYRARRVPFWLGKHGQTKYEIGKIFQERTRSARLNVDISCDDKEAFMGDDWYRFLYRCKAVLGCEGGASLFDPTGAIRQSVEKYVSEHPKASFEEAEQNCFKGMDHNIHLFCLSPRHFEAAITRTCQVLMEGEYGGIFEAGVHYIELKKDYSNLDTVIGLLHDDAYCMKIAENAYRDIVESGKYTYRVFANKVVNYIAEKADVKTKETRLEQLRAVILSVYLLLREAMEPLLAKGFYFWLGLKFYKLKAFKKFVQKIKDNRSLNSRSPHRE
ncbi:MAG: hypothetical protein ABID54_05330 [Pseudomonadota bacterium]